jgi:NIMA (never in mitosis gene a)-related kinase
MDPKQREKCLKEVRLLESLDHPNIIKYLDSFIESNQLFIAIEWAEKGDLKKLIKKCQSDETTIDEKRIWEYLYQIASALKHMQDRRIMHRDLKPANIFLVADGSLKLGDLGLGRFMSSQTIEAFSRVGTPLYMSPEVLKGSGYDWKSDIWSLGCIVYELACLRSPFKRDDEKMSLYDLFQTISKGEYPPLPSRYSEELKQVVSLMIQILPQNRLSTEQIVELCEIQLKANVKKHRVDPFLVMDDIAEKLKLLKYEKFLKDTNRKPLSKVYFALESDRTEQLRCFCDLCNWIMSLRNPSQNPVYLGVRTDPDRIVTTVLNSIKNYGVKVPEFVTSEALKNGFGEAVCFIVNDLLNKELIRQDYRFETPVLIENGIECYGDPPEGLEFYEEMPSGDPEMIFFSPEVEQVVENDEVFFQESEKTLIDPSDWLLEVKRVEKKLVLQDSPDLSPNTLKKTFQVIKQFNHSENPVILSSKALKLTEDLEKIKSKEQLLQRMFKVETLKAKEVLEISKALRSPVRSFSTGSKVLEKFNFKRNHVESLKTQLEEIEKRMKIFEKTPHAVNPVPKMKESIVKLKKDLRQLELTTGILRTYHNSCLVPK